MGNPHPVPKVYIDDRLMDSYATDAAPVLAGLTLDFGVSNNQDMQGVETCSFELCIREQQDMSFLDLGKLVAVVHQPVADESSFTYFVGRIQRASAKLDTEIPGALRVSVQAADLTADLVNEQPVSIWFGAQDAWSRLGSLNQFIMPAGWGLIYYPLRWTDRQHAEWMYKQKPALEILDQYLRAQIMLRRNSSDYQPGTGVRRSITIMQDESRATAVDTITYTAGRPLVRTPGVPVNTLGTVHVPIDGGNVHQDVEWTKEPEDVITDVTLQRIDALVRLPDGSPYPPVEEATRTPISSRLYVDTTAMRTKYGVRTIEFDTDLPAGGATADLVPIYNHWLNPESKWRPKSLRIRDTTELTLEHLAWLVSPTSRFTTYVTVDNLTPNRPNAEESLIRGYCMGGRAVWAVPGQGRPGRWELEITLGRDSLTVTGGDYWTPALIAAAGWDTSCATVGDELTFADFKRIGQ